MDYIVVLITASSEEEAKKIAHGLVDAGVCACVNIVPRIESVFVWEGKKDVAQESLLIVKTKKDRFPALEKEVKRLHSYSVPEIIALPIAEGHKKYLEWISEVVR